MKLSNVSGNEPRSVENRISRGPRRLAIDPLLHLRQTQRGLVDVVEFGNVVDRAQQLLDACFALGQRMQGACLPRATRRADSDRHSSDPCHAVVFLHGIVTRAGRMPARCAVSAHSLAVENVNGS
jgi:hypothetical protein